MRAKIILSALILSAFLSGCSKLPHFATHTQETPQATNQILPAKKTYVNDPQSIKLQNPKTRVIVICRESFYETAETCARFYEKRHYVRLRNIPYKVAKYDRLTKDTFPTRRWRNGERTPRW